MQLILKIPSDNILQIDLLSMINVYIELYKLVGVRSVDSFYDYVSLANAGMLLKNSIIYTSQIDILDDKKIITDKPEKKKEAVFDEKGRKRYPRDPDKVKSAIYTAGCKSEYESSHYSFMTKNEKNMYVEAHHLIPVKLYNDYEKSVDVEANIVSLCPDCHRCIHHGSKKEKLEIVTALLNLRKDRLQAVELNCSLEKLVGYYAENFEEKE